MKWIFITMLLTLISCENSNDFSYDVKNVTHREAINVMRDLEAGKDTFDLLDTEAIVGGEDRTHTPKP